MFTKKLTIVATTNKPKDGGHVDDPTSMSIDRILLQHLCDDELGAVEDGLDIHCHGSIPSTLWCFMELQRGAPGLQGDSCIVDES